MADITGEIYEMAKALGAGDAAGLSAMCAAATDYFVSRLKDGVTTDDCHDPLITAGALLALELYGSASGSPGMISGYSAGQVSVSFSEGDMTGRSGQAEVIMAPYLYDTGFDFRGVDG